MLKVEGDWTGPIGDTDFADITGRCEDAPLLGLVFEDEDEDESELMNAPSESELIQPIPASSG